MSEEPTGSGETSERRSYFQFGKTHWPLVQGAGQGEGDNERNALLERYHEAIYRYLHCKLADPHAADEVYSLFVERVKENHPFLRRADPEKGRFRDYLRRVLQRMVVDYWRQRQREANHRRELTPGAEAEAAVAAPEIGADDEDFRRAWIEELMSHAWQALQEAEKVKGQPYHTLLLHRARNPGDTSEKMALHFGPLLNRPLSAENVRQLLHRGQELLSDLLVREAARSLEEKLGEPASADRVEEELIDLGLFDKHRKKALERFKEKPK